MPFSSPLSARLPAVLLGLGALATALPAPAARTAKFVGHFMTGPQPTTVSLLAGGRELAVANRGDESLWILDADTLEPVAKHSVVGRHGIWAAAERKEGRLVVSHWKGESISLLDRATGELGASIPVGIKPSYVALSPDGTKAYVAGNLSGDVALVDLEKSELERLLEVGQKPMGVAASPDGRWLYVAACKSRKISRVDLKYEVVLDHFGAPLAATTNLAITPDGSILLAAGDDDRLLLIDAETGRTDKVKLPGDPAGVAVSPDGRTAYVACYEAGLVAVVDLASRALIDELPVGPGCIDVATDGRRLYAVNDQGGSISVYELAEAVPAEVPPAALPEPVERD
jgi:DNA-binding beta-propeller fold protein YncE